jgi:hypothetical protein
VDAEGVRNILYRLLEKEGLEILGDLHNTGSVEGVPLAGIVGHA